MRDHENPRYERDRRGERDDSRRELYAGQDYSRGSEGQRGGSWGGQSRPGDYEQRGGEYEQGRQYGQGRRGFDEEVDREGGEYGQETQNRVMRFQRWNQPTPESASRTGFNNPGSGDYGSARASYGSGFYGSGSSYGQQGYGQERTGEHRGKGPKGYQRSDERLKEMICEKLTDDPSIDASEVSVEVQGQVVTLDGTVESRQTKYEIESLVEECGAKDVTNNLKVSKSQSSQGRSAQGQSGQGQDNGSSSRSQDGQGSQNKEGKSRTSSGKY